MGESHASLANELEKTWDAGARAIIVARVSGRMADRERQAIAWARDMAERGEADYTLRWKGNVAEHRISRRA